MIELLFACLPLFAFPPAVSPPSLVAESPAPAPCVAQDDEEEIQDNRAEVKDLIAKLKGHVKKKGKEDQDAIMVIDALYGEFAKSGPKDRAAIVKELEKCFKVKRKDLDEDVPDNRLYIACAVSMGGMGPESVKPLMGLIGHKSHRDDILLQEKLILSLGKTGDPKAVDTLTGLLKHHEPRIQAAGAEALGNFASLELKERKKVFEELLKTLMRVKAQVDANVTDPIARDRYDTTAGPIITTLKILTAHEENSPEGWQHWWNKNKKADWDEGEG